MPSTPQQHPSLFSKQVSEAAYFFLDLHPSRRTSLAVCVGGRERCDPDYRIHRRKYGYTVIEFVMSGAGSVRLDGKTFPLGPGSVFAYRRNTHCEITTDPVRRLVKFFVCLAGRTASAQLALSGVPTGQAEKLSSYTEIHSLLAQLVGEGQRQAALSGAICHALLDLILLRVRETLAYQPEPSSLSREKFTHLKQLIDAKPLGFSQLGEVARQAGVTPATACKLFHRYLGISPFRYLTRLKMEIAAKHLMENGGLIKEAAARLGFKDPYHFSRRFKLMRGTAPSEICGRWANGGSRARQRKQP